MGFDKIYAPLTAIGDYFHKEMDVKSFIHKEFTLKSKKELVIFVSPGFKEPFSFLLKRRVLKKNKSFLEYYFTTRIVSSDYKLTKEYFERAKIRITKDIHRISHRFKKVTLIGMSLSCANALMIADNNKEIDKLILVIPGNCIAEGVWKSVRTKKIKKEFEEQGINLRKLKEYWKDLNTKNNANNLRVKEIIIYLSKADESIPYENGMRLVNDLKSKGLKIKLRENERLGHYLTAMHFYLNSKDI